MKRLVVGLLAHVDSGKTTLAEGLLYRAGVLRKLGRVDHRDAFLDTDSQERARGITIFAKQAVLTLPAADGADETELTLLDTPGHVDFSAEAERALLRKVEPHDLVKFGLIPELIGRLPVITVLDDLDEDALVRVLKEPRNSLIKQYKELLGMDNVELTFTDEALHAIARKTIERKTGARGLRSVMESILLPIMYEVPSDATIIRVTVDEDTVEGGEAHLEYGAVRKRYKNQVALS